MLPDGDGRVRVRANISGEVEIKANLSQLFYSGQCLAVVEGDQEIESLSVRKPSEVIEICVEDGSEVEAGTTLLVVRELKE